MAATEQPELERVAGRDGRPTERNGRPTHGFRARRRLGSNARNRRGWLVRRLLLVADVGALLIAFGITEAIFSGQKPGAIGPSVETTIFLATLPGWIVGAKVYGLYDRDPQKADATTVEE